MRAQQPIVDTSIIARQIEAAFGVNRLRDMRPNFEAASPDVVEAVLQEAARFAHEQLEPLNEIADRLGCRLVNGRVETAPGHKDAWRAFCAGGWNALDLPEDYGGQALPLFLALAVQEIFDRSCNPFGMMPVPLRSAVRLIGAFADEALKDEWLPKLVSGEWCATICISEPDAGSDTARARTRAAPNGDGSWSVTGEKIWISYGDQDITARIGHCLLARTPDAPGLSLFLVPDSIDGARNNVFVRRIEEKMGLHMSPTCALGFEGARGFLLGKEGRGLAQMFVMITNMRLSTGVQGLGIAAGASDIALAYAEERRQGGTGERAVPIVEHADVQRMLLSMVSRVETLRGLAMAIAIQADIAATEEDPNMRDSAAAFVQWMLPIFKTWGGETAFQVSSDAMQTLGGAGFTREWPVEQAMRDSRVLTIFEGTTGIQALDLLHRRLWRDGAPGLKSFLAIARADAAASQRPDMAEEAVAALDSLETAANALQSMKEAPFEAEAGATAFLNLAGLAATGWVALRLCGLEGSDRAALRLRAAGEFWLRGLGARARAAQNEATLGAAGLRLIQGVRATG